MTWAVGIDAIRAPSSRPRKALHWRFGAEEKWR